MNEAAITDLGTKLDLLTARVNRLEKLLMKILLIKGITKYRSCLKIRLLKQLWIS